MKTVLEDLLCACDARGIDRKLALSVVLALGAGEIAEWEEVCQNLREIAEDGAGGGFSGFAYYTETVAFYREHREKIIDCLRARAEDAESRGPVSFAYESNCAQGLSEEDVATALFAPMEKEPDDGFVQIANGLAWFALEEVARVFVDLEEERRSMLPGWEQSGSVSLFKCGLYIAEAHESKENPGEWVWEVDWDGNTLGSGREDGEEAVQRSANAFLARLHKSIAKAAAKALKSA